MIDVLFTEKRGFSVNAWKFNKEAEADNFGTTVLDKLDGLDFHDRLPGFHDYEEEITDNGHIVRGWCSAIVPFTVEHLVDDIPTETLFERIESVEFIKIKDYLFVWGKARPMKFCVSQIRGDVESGLTKVSFDVDMMKNATNMLTDIKSVNIVNPSRRAGLSQVKLIGEIDALEEYDQVVDIKTYGISTIKGKMSLFLVEGLAITINQNGNCVFGIKPEWEIPFKHLIAFYEQIQNV